MEIVLAELEIQAIAELLQHVPKSLVTTPLNKHFVKIEESVQSKEIVKDILIACVGKHLLHFLKMLNLNIYF